MTASEVVAARVESGLSAAECAEWLEVPEAALAEWEAGQRRIPRHSARVLQWLAAKTRRSRAIDAARLAECAWVAERIDRPQPVEDAEFRRELDEWQAHAASCPACQAREKWIDTHLGSEPQKPNTVTEAVFFAILRPVAAVGRPFMALPEWTRLGVVGAVLGFVMSAFDWSVDRSLRGFVLATVATGVAGLLLGGINKLFKR